MKNKTFVIVLTLALLCSCSPFPNIAGTTTARPLMVLPTSTATVRSTATEVDTPVPTTTPVPSPVLSPRDMALAEHERERIVYLAEQGPAEEIPVLEYHGDNYGMTFGTAVVELEPEAFEAQMKWFYDNHVYAVTGQNLIDWINGKIELPARSVVLTFDMGYNSAKAIHRIIPEFEKYGMFGIFTIFTKFMNEGESVNCVNDACWEAFRYAYLSGYVDIGSHTMTHRDFATLSEKEGLDELANSKETIEEHVGNGCVVSILTWPYESVPKWGKDISRIGFVVAFAGYQYPILQNAIWRDKPEDFYQEPRILPPNSNGISGRPNGKDLEGIMWMYTSANSNHGGW